MPKNGKIVGVHGRNISISVDNSEVNAHDADQAKYIGVTLPALNKRDIDFAVEHLNEFHNFGSCNGYLWFPEEYEVKAGLTHIPTRDGQ